MRRFHGRLCHVGQSSEVEGFMGAKPGMGGGYLGLIVTAGLGRLAQEDGPITLEIQYGLTWVIAIQSRSEKGAEFETVGPPQ